MADQELREHAQNIVAWVKALPSNMPYYIQDRFPIIRWLPRYSSSWTFKDLVAGITVGLIVVPQGMSYAKVAELPVQHGLYSAYIGAIFYCFMGTSKDLTIGPTAVISLITGELVAQLADRYSPAQIAGISCLAVGALTMLLGVLQLGIILDFFPSTVLVGYTTGAAATIVVSQIPKWMGVSGVNTREPAYLVLINTFKQLPTLSWLDFLFGLVSMAGLVGIGMAVDRWGRGRFSIQLIKISRFFIVTVLATAFSFLVNINAPLDAEGNMIPRISILKTVPGGLPAPQVPPMTGTLLAEIAPKLLAIALATILEHIAIGKAFARKNRYQIDSNQELLTLGLANVTASFFGAYTVTGSFSRSAVKFQCGVKTPLAGLVTGAVVLLALQMLTPLFFYIPDAALSAVIMVAVSSLISRPPVFLEFFDVNLWDFLSSQIALWVTIFVSVEVGIATGVGFSLAVLLFRVARPQLQVLRPLRTRPDVFVVSADSSSLSSMDYRYRSIRDTASLPPGVLVFRMEESATFPNMETFKTWAQDQVYRHTRFGGVVRTAHDRLWSDNLELHIQRLRTHQHLQQQYALNEQQHRLSRMERRYNEGDEDTTTSLLHSKPSSPPLLPFSPSSSSSSSSPLPSDKDLPFLRAVILDCSAMNNIDTTGLQGIRDLNENLKDYAGVRDDPTRFFELHFTGVQETVLPILERSGLTLPTRPPPLPSFSSYSETVISPTTTTPLHQLHEAGHANEPQRDRSDQHQSRKSSSSSIDSLRSIGSVPSLDSLIHLTIRDAVDAVLSHASAWRRAIADNGGTIRGAAEGARSSTPTTVGESVINVDDYGESSSMISDPESDQDSTHKQPSTHELQYI